jgi:micrococcal nuclease
VVKVVDGDTIDVQLEGQQYRIRYILVDTPETYGGTEPFGPEASAFNAQLVDGQTVWLEKDVSETDRYGRLLRYVYLADGRMVNEELLRAGLATVATFPPDVKYVDRFLTVQAEAQRAGVGLWQGVEPPPSEPPVTEVAPSPAEPTGTGPLVITALNKQAEYADIQNVSGVAVDLTGWRLLSEKGNQDCPLNGIIEPGQTLRVWALSADAAQAGFNCGFGRNIWNNSERDPAVLFDASGGEVSRRE